MREREKEGEIDRWGSSMQKGGRKKERRLEEYEAYRMVLFLL